VKSVPWLNRKEKQATLLCEQSGCASTADTSAVNIACSFQSGIIAVEQELSRKLMKLLNYLQPEAGSYYSFSLSGDPRVTRFGSFLRRSSLDNVPQFWKVIKGDRYLTWDRQCSKRLANGDLNQNQSCYLAVWLQVFGRDLIAVSWWSYIEFVCAEATMGAEWIFASFGRPGVFRTL
jgi:hypothetical protein